MFQHTAARRRLENLLLRRNVLFVFQHTAARRRLGAQLLVKPYQDKFQHTAARRRLADNLHPDTRFWHCFNTQPPEGGWDGYKVLADFERLFQHTAARRRLGHWQAFGFRVM